MKIVIAPQHFKESLSGLQAAKAIEKGVKRVMSDAECVLIPVADGGDGTLQILVQHTKGKVLQTTVKGPIGKPVVAKWGSLGDGTTAVLEMAQASGLALLATHERDPRITTTFGVGQVFKEALDRGHRRFIVAIGGSATNDGGTGFARALGAQFLDSEGKELAEGGLALKNLSSINVSKLDKRLSECEVQVACDVNNPLCGDTGASAIFGPQKGATPEMVKELDRALSQYAAVIYRDLGRDVKDLSGAGAAGGLGAGLMVFTNALLKSGADIVLDTISIDKQLIDADLVLVAEGGFDLSSVFNKSPVAVAKRAKRYKIPVIGIGGTLAKGYKEVHNYGIDTVFSIVSRPMELSDAIETAESLLTDVVEEIFKTLLIGSNLQLYKKRG